MNWGYKLVIGMLLFMAFIVTLAVRMMSQHVDLVTDHYYEAGIHYDVDHAARQAAQLPGASFRAEKHEDGIQLVFPKGADGTVWLYRASNSLQDVKLPIQTDANGRQFIQAERLTKGPYRIIARWKLNNILYLQEKDLFW